MSFVPPQWNGGIQEWIRKAANAINGLIPLADLAKSWPAVTTTGAIGYSAGAGGTVTQATSKSTGVTLNKICGEITLNAASLAAGSSASFTLTSSSIQAHDVLILNHVSGGTFGAYALNARAAAGSAAINIRNVTAGDLAEAVVLRFSVIQGVIA